jgi:DNA-binding NarL/FixJ family response regulator
MPLERVNQSGILGELSWLDAVQTRKSVVGQRVCCRCLVPEPSALLPGLMYPPLRVRGGISDMKFLVIDDHVLIRESLRGVLCELEPEAAVLEAANAHEAMGLVSEHPDFGLVLLDLGLPDRDGFEVLAEIRERHPTIPVVVLSGHHDRGNVVRALDLGALGFIPKTAQRRVLLSAVSLVLSGGIYIPPEILGRQERPAEPGTGQTTARKPAVSPRDLGLTDRQVEVLALMMQGKSNKAIGRTLDLAEPTVRNHVTAILKALNVTNRTEAVMAVVELGWNLRPTTTPS